MPLRVEQANRGFIDARIENLLRAAFEKCDAARVSHPAPETIAGGAAGARELAWREGQHGDEPVDQARSLLRRARDALQNFVRISVKGRSSAAPRSANAKRRG